MHVSLYRNLRLAIGSQNSDRRKCIHNTFGNWKARMMQIKDLWMPNRLTNIEDNHKMHNARCMDSNGVRVKLCATVSMAMCINNGYTNYLKHITFFLFLRAGRISERISIACANHTQKYYKRSFAYSASPYNKTFRQMLSEKLFQFENQHINQETIGPHASICSRCLGILFK